METIIQSISLRCMNISSKISLNGQGSLAIFQYIRKRMSLVDSPLMQTKYAFAIALLLNIHDSSFSKCRNYSDDRTVNKSKAVYINYNRSGPDKYYAKKCQRKIENTMADG